MSKSSFRRPSSRSWRQSQKRRNALARLAATSRLVGQTASDQAIYSIDFDIAVSVGSESGAEGGAKLQVASVFSIGGKAKESDKTESVSRVKFAVPITLPVDAASDQERAERKARLKAEEERRRKRAHGVAAR